MRQDCYEEAKVSETMTYTVPGMSCGHCKSAVEQELGEVGGVERVEVDLDTKLVTVQGSGLTDEALRGAIEEAGYEAA
jgi:copper chaperone